MKKILVLIILGAMLLVGCGKKAEPSITPSRTDTPTNSGQAGSPSVAPNDNQPTPKDLERLSKKLDETTDEAERKKILADIQIILDQAEANAPK